MLDIIACFIELRLPNHCWQVQLMREWLFGTFRLFLFHQPVVAAMEFWVILYTNWLKKKDLLILVEYFSLTGKTRTIA